MAGVWQSGVVCNIHRTLVLFIYIAFSLTEENVAHGRNEEFEQLILYSEKLDSFLHLKFFHFLQALSIFKAPKIFLVVTLN